MQEGVKQVPKLAIGLMLYLVQEAGLHQGAKTHELGLAYFNKQVLLGYTPAGQEPTTEQPHFKGKPSGNQRPPAGRSQLRSTIFKARLDRRMQS